MKPKILFLALLFSFLLLVPMISASKVYDEGTNTYQTYDWLFFKKYDIKLNEVSDSIINSYASGELVVHKDAKVFKDMYYKDKTGTSLTFDKNKGEDFKIYINDSYMTYKYLPNYSKECGEDIFDEYLNDYVENCTLTEIGGEWVEDGIAINWVEVDVNEKILEGYYLWKIEAKKPINKVVDFIIQTDDEGDLTEWAWWNTSFDYKQNITAIGGEYPTFNISYTANMDGSWNDLRFVDSTETVELNYSIRANVSNGWAFVTVDTNNDSLIYMYYGNNTPVTTTSNVSNTFHNPVAYFTFDNAQKLANGGQLDWTGNGYDASTIGAGFTYGNGTDGTIGESYTFTRTTYDNIQVTNLPIDDNDYTTMFRMQLTNTATDGAFPYWRGANSGTNAATFMEWRTSGTTLWSGQYANDVAWTGSGTYISDDTWIYIGDHRLGNINMLYINGTNVINASHSALSLGSQAFIIGEGAAGRLSYTVMDEMILYSDDISNELAIELTSMAEYTPTFGAEESNIVPVEPINITLVEPSDAYNSTSSSIFFNCTCEYSLGCTSLNMTIDNIQVAEVTNSTIENLTLTYTNNSIPDGNNYEWYCTGISDGKNETNSSIYTFSVDANAPFVNITSPLDGFIVTQYNEEIDLNWTITDINLDSCWYQENIYETMYDDGINITAGTLQFGAWIYVTDYTTQYFEVNFKGGDFIAGYIQVFKDNDTTIGDYQTINPNAIDGVTENVSMDLYSNGWHYVIVDIEDNGQLEMFRTTEPTSFLMNYTILNCSENHTTFNYSIYNPDSWEIILFANDTFGFRSSDNSTIYKSTVAPVITLTSPITLYSSLNDGESVDLNWSYTNSTILDTCWYSYNGTNTTVTCEDLTSTFNYSTNVNTLTFYANDTLGNLGSTSISWIVLAVTSDIIFESEVIETDTTDFIAVVELTENVTSVTGNFIYDGNTYTATPVTGANQTNLTYTLDVPIYDMDKNVSFYFSINVTTTNGSGVATTNVNNQTVLELLISNCVLNDSNRIANYTTRIARSPFALLNTTLASSWFYYLQNGTGNVVKETAYEDTSENESRYAFCLNRNETIIVNNQIEVSATGYVASSNFLVGAELNKQNTTSQTIYLLNSTLADATVLQVFDQSGFPVGNVLINIQYFDIGTNSYITVTQALTSSIGSDVVYLNWLDSLYKFVLVQNGQTVQTTLPENIFESPRIFTLNATSGLTFLEFQGIDYNIYYNNNTQDFVLTFAKPSGKFVQGCLRVNKKQTAGDLNICDTCTSAASATLLCNIGAYGDGTYVATFYGIGSYQAIDWIIQIIGKNFSHIIFDEIGGEDASFYAFLLGLVTTGVMFVNPIAGIVAILLGIFIGNILGFVLINYITFIGLAVTGGVIAWLIRG